MDDFSDFPYSNTVTVSNQSMSAENASTSSIADTGEYDPYFHTEPALRWRYQVVETRCVTPIGDEEFNDSDTDDDMD